MPDSVYQLDDKTIHSAIQYMNLSFIENHGQVDSKIKYYAKTFAGTVYVTDSDLIYQTIKNQDDLRTTLIINEKFLGNTLRPQGTIKSESTVSYFKGSQEDWKTNIPTYDYVSLGQVWDNVNVDLRAYGNNMEKIFTVHPGGNPSDIKMSLEGISDLSISNEDELAVNTDLGYAFLSKPIGYQFINGKKHDVQVKYDVFNSNTYGFSVLSYDPRFDLVIDPLISSTFIGGTGDDAGIDITRDSSGNVYVTGRTADDTTDFPTTAGVYDTTHNGSDDVFVSKFNTSLTTLSASTLIGGSGNDVGWGIVLDSTNNAYITGETNSTTNFPVTSGAYDTTHNGSYDVFVSKFNSALSTLSASTLIGASGNDYGYMIALDGAGNAYITGSTEDVATDFPVTSGAYDTTHATGTDAFVSNLDCNLASSSSTCTATVSSGSNTTVSVASGGTGQVQTPSGNTLSVTLPTGVSGSITFKDTNSGTSASNISFLGNIIDIVPAGGATCNGGCTISFTFTGSQAASAGFSPSQVVVLHDSNENGSFESGENLKTTISGTDPYTATATASFTSKFAVGGVRANAVAAAQSLSTGGFFDFLKSCDPDGFSSGKSLKVYEVRYDRCESKKLEILAHSTCGPIIAQATTDSGTYTLGISSTQPFLNDKEKKIVLGAELSPTLKSFNLMLKDKRDHFTDKLYLNKCNDTKIYSYVTGYTSEQQSPFFYGSYDNVEQIHQQSTQNVVDPEPNQIITQNVVDPEPIDEKPKNGLLDMIINTFSKIFRR